MSDQGSAFEWRRKRDRVDKLLERVEHAPQSLLSRGLVTIPQKRPPGCQGAALPRSELKVGYAKRKSSRDVAIDWPGSSRGRFS